MDENRLIQRRGLAITKPFNNLDAEKQKRILNAALKEFAENGYDKASTNRIVKDAGIGKGMLFYYFKNKKELCHYLIDYTIDMMANKYVNLFQTKEPDFFERITRIAQAEFVFNMENPYVGYFLTTLVGSDDLELSADAKERFEELQQFVFPMLYADIDHSLFREDVDVEKTLQLIQWSLEGFNNELTNQFKKEEMDFSSLDLASIWEEFYEYINIFKTSFYKQEGDTQ